MALMRACWESGNRVHWVRDITMGEDRSQVHMGKPPCAMVSRRNLAIGAPRLAGEENIARGPRWGGRDPTRALQLLGL
jgi:hypothetical protein